MSVARSYAKALYEAARDAKISSGDMDQLESKLGEVQNFLDSSKDARMILMGPSTAARDKAVLVAQFADKLKLSELLKNFLVLLARKERLTLFEEVKQSFGAVRLEAEGGVLGYVVSADPLAPADIEGLSKSFSDKLGKRVAFQTSIDPAMLAGVKVTVNGVTYDGTLLSQLQRLRDRLVHGTSAIH